MLVPESKSEKEQAHLARMTAWLAKMPENERKMYCDHACRKALAKLCCKYCKEAKEDG